MDKSKIILIVGAVFIVIALALSTVSVIMMSSVLKQVRGDNEAATEEEGEEPHIPLSATTNYELSSPVVAVVKSESNPSKTMNKSIEIGFLLNNENKKTPDILELMTTKEGVIRDRISKLIETKSVEDFESNHFTEKLQKEILDLISAELDTDTIVEVYFMNNLGTTRD